jgi:hypothetical protein
MDGSVKPLKLNTTFDSYDELKESVAHSLPKNKFCATV